MKQCNTCGVTKDHSEFSTKPGRNGIRRLSHECKMCRSAKSKAKYANETQEERENRISKAKAWKASNRDVVNGLKRKYNLQKKVIKLSSMPHDHHVRAYQSYQLKQSLKHDQHVRAYQSYQLKQSLKHDQHVKEWKSFVRYAVYQRLKRGVQRGMKDKAANSNWPDYLGYSVGELVDHIESQFTDGMGWHNMSEWHRDHILPIRSFDLDRVDSEDFKRCYSLDNLMPVWAEDNMNKYWSVDRVFNKKNKEVNNVIN